MAFNGSGVFVRLYSWIADRNAAIKIRADRMDAEMDGMATGLSNCITKDGQTTITQDIPFNNKRLTSLADATAATDAVNRQFADARYKSIDLGDGLIDVQIFSASGTWTKPAGCVAVEVFVWGGGGSGASSVSPSASQGSVGSGGGGGGFTYEYIASLPNATEAVTVGAGGASPVAGANNGAAGGNSSFGTVPYLTATGGQGGTHLGTTANNFGEGGAPGTGANGGVIMTGEYGGVAFVSTGTNSAIRYSGSGGASPQGGSGGGPILGGTSTAGRAGVGPGAGGSGALSFNSGAAAAGGAGAAGLVIVKSYG